MRGKDSLQSYQSLVGVTPYPWYRNYKGDLCGANGEPICFVGPDAVVVEHSPEMAEALEKIRSIARASRHTASLEEICLVANALLKKLENAHQDHRWCRGTVR